MKKILVLGLIFIGIGFSIGKIVFEGNYNFFNKINNTEKYYFLQEGVYSNYSTIQNNLIGIREKVIENTNNHYYVYLGITKDKEISEKLKKIYLEKGLKLTEIEKNISSREFYENVTQFDLLMNETDEVDELLTIEEVVLANYNEIMKNQ